MDEGGEEEEEEEEEEKEKKEEEELGSSGAPGDERGAGNNLQMEQTQDADVEEEVDEEFGREAKRAKLQ